MARRRSNHPWRLVNLAILVSAASARTISLSSFELISSIFIAPSCLDAYNSPLQGCELEDFLMGRQCSQSCITNLRRTEATIQQACKTAKPRPGTLLSRTQNGELVAALCGTQAGDGGAEGGTAIPSSTSVPMNSASSTWTTVTKAITPKPPPTASTTTIMISSLPSTSTQRPSTAAESTSTNSALRSSSLSSQAPRSTAPSSIPPLVASSTSSRAASSTAAPGGSGNTNGGGNSLPGNGGGGLDSVGITASGMTATPSRLVGLSALVCALIIVAL